MGARTIVKTSKGAAKRIIREPKAIAKAVIKPATMPESRLVMIGALASPIANMGYSYAYNFIISKIPQLATQPIIAQIIKIALPLVPAYFVGRFKVPAGNVINGCLYGMTGAQIINLLIALAMSGGKLPTTKPTIDAAELEITTEPITPWEG
ncbi:hypothetical protein ES702_05203 [subsurface metagenome]